MEHGIKRLNRELIRRGAILNIYKDSPSNNILSIIKFDLIRSALSQLTLFAKQNAPP